MKLQFRILGKLLIIPILAFGFLILPFAFISRTNLTLEKDLIWCIFFGLLLSFVIFFLWRELFTQILMVEADDKIIMTYNLVTTVNKQIDLSSISAYKAGPHQFSGYAIRFLGNDGKTLLKINGEFYKNIDDFMKTLKIKNLK